ERQVWPLSMIYFERVLVVLAWCRLRADYRTFRLDRIERMDDTGQSFRPRRARLLADFLARFADRPDR
ncbi:MAG: WYL domain-containing protein, partial [Alphaproteobacteria bacterium]|nr:WYL domain-containing protein [Alphaproteobacteria bacterium]